MSRRFLIACVMTAWGAFLLWFAWTNTMARFLGPRTYWVAWFGAFGLLLAGVAGLRGAVRGGSAATLRDIGGAGLMVIPLILVLVLPAPQLGAQAASRKAAGVGALSSFVPAPSGGGDIGLKEIHYASLSADYADTLGITDGLVVELTGFVTHPDEAGEEFGLTRFYISCCAADAVPFTVIVRPGDTSAFSDDTWLTVEGELVRSGSSFVLEATRITKAQEPSAPYLY